MHQNTDWENDAAVIMDKHKGGVRNSKLKMVALIHSLLQAREEWLKGEIEKKLAKARDYYQETRLQPLEGEMSAFRDVLSLINKK